MLSLLSFYALMKVFRVHTGTYVNGIGTKCKLVKKYKKICRYVVFIKYLLPESSKLFAGYSSRDQRINLLRVVCILSYINVSEINA